MESGPIFDASFLVVRLLLFLALLVLAPAAIFRVMLRARRLRWARVDVHMSPGAYRGSTVVTEVAARIPLFVRIASLASLYVVEILLPILLWVPFLGPIVAANVIVARGLLRPSREGARAARVLAALEIAWLVVMLVACAFSHATVVILVPAVIAHVVVLLAAARANDHANVAACA